MLLGMPETRKALVTHFMRFSFYCTGLQGEKKEKKKKKEGGKYWSAVITITNS